MKQSRILYSLFLAIVVVGLYFYMSPESKIKRIEKDTSRQTSEIDRFYDLADLAKSSFQLKKFDEAKKYAEELLFLAPKYTSNWNYGNAIHDGNMVLGRIALHEGDMETAKAYLLKAGRTPGSPQLGSFGPNMSLANDFLKRGEKEAVLEYFNLCKVFWKHDFWQLDIWIFCVRHNLPVFFRANLNI